MNGTIVSISTREYPRRLSYVFHCPIIEYYEEGFNELARQKKVYGRDIIIVDFVHPPSSPMWVIYLELKL